MNDYEKRPELAKIYEKGYSTKGDGRGMGLYVAHSLMHRHEDMFCECEVEKGRFIQKLEILI